MGKKTANTISSTYAELAESYGAEVTSVDDLNQTFELLNTGRIDATLNAELTFYDYINAHPEKNLKIAALTDDASLVCIPMRKGEDSKSLREAVDQAIDEIRESGELAKLSDKYFGMISLRSRRKTELQINRQADSGTDKKIRAARSFWGTSCPYFL